jgi:hypothetical protein
VFDLREELISRLAIYEGTVTQRVYKRVFETSKNGKTRDVAPSDTAELLRTWRDLAEDPSVEGFVFASEALTTRLSPDNLWRRTMRPKLEKIGLGWATFQILRKTNASLSKKYGVTPRSQPTNGVMALASAWRCTPIPTWSRSAKQ